MLRPITSLLLAILDDESSLVLAASLTYGMILGFVPKDNLLAAILGAFLLAGRFNLTVGTASAALFSGLAAMFDSVADALGRSVLTHADLSPFWAWLYQLPLAPWTRFNNTVVMGSLLLALGLATPLYLTVRFLLVQYRPRLTTWVNQSGVRQWLGIAGGAAA
jgi:uncharacterized protein (TIGR03546 family)